VAPSAIEWKRIQSEVIGATVARTSTRMIGVLSYRFLITSRREQTGVRVMT
jgi:hypothetical protein